MPSISKAAKMYTPRQPKRSLIDPENTRASSSPINTPLCAAPTTRPCSWGAAALAAYAISPWVIAVPSRPTASIQPNSITAVEAILTAARAAISKITCVAIRRRRFTLSPSGTSSSNAIAQPIWVAAITPPIAASPIAKSRASASSSGCA